MTKELEIFSKEYVLEHGVAFDADNFTFECYYKGKIYYNDQLFDMPIDEGGKPVSGIVYTLFPDGELNGYKFYKDGFQNGDDVTFYSSGTPSRFSRYTDSENFIYEWYENGNIKLHKENHRHDSVFYYRIKEYDESGRLVRQLINCEINYVHDYNMPDTSYDVFWHDNGEFKKIVDIKPSRDTFYTEMEFDEYGYPIRYEINPFYYPEYMSLQKQKKSDLSFFDKDYCFGAGGILMKKSFSNSWYKYSGKVAFLYKRGFLQKNDDIEKINEFIEGKPLGEQYVYYRNGQIKETYCIEQGQEYGHHIYWYENGTIKEIVIYSHDRFHKTTICFAENGEVISRTEA